MLMTSCRCVRCLNLVKRRIPATGDTASTSNCLAGHLVIASLALTKPDAPVFTAVMKDVRPVAVQGSVAAGARQLTDCSAWIFKSSPVAAENS